MDNLGKFTTMIQSWKSEYLHAKDIDKQLNVIEGEGEGEGESANGVAGGSISPNEFNECKNFFENKKVEYIKNHNDQKSLKRMENAQIHFLATMTLHSNKSS